MSLAYAIHPGHGLAARRRGERWPALSPQGSTLHSMAATATTDKAELAVEEARLARAAAEGDGGAFATLYERYAQRAYNLAYRVSGSEDDAADATQEAFLNVMRRLPKLGDRELAFGSYLFTATRNACYDLIEKRRRPRIR
jgi:RNA polymerase sigma-70 factor (ECF subfamily)